MSPDVLSFTAPERIVLTDGIPLYVLRGGSEEVVRVDVVVAAGTFDQQRLLQALFTNRLLREGTATTGYAALAEQLDWYGAWLELSVSLHHSFLTLYTLRRYAVETCTLLSEMLLTPLFPEERFEVIRANNRNQYRVTNRRGEVQAHRALLGTVFGLQHPCGRFAVEEDYDRITRDDLLAYYRSHYIASNFSLYLAGKVDDTLVALMEKLFGELPVGTGTGTLTGTGTDERSKSRAELVRAMPCKEEKKTRSGLTITGTAEPQSTMPLETAEPQHMMPLMTEPLIPAGAKGATVRRVLPEAPQDSICMGALMMDIDSDEYARMRVLTTVLGGYFGSRLMQTIREEMGYTYGINADLITNTRQALFTVSSETMAGKADEVVAGVKAQCERLCNDLIPDSELTLVRNYMHGELCRNYEGVFALADAWIYVHTHHLPDSHLDHTALIARTADAASLRDTARRWLNPDCLTSVVVGPEPAPGK